MKTIQKGSEIRRESDSDAEVLVRSRGYMYVPKSVCKERNGMKVTEQVVEQVVEQPVKKEKFKKGNKK